jgi:hypothetical protein
MARVKTASPPSSDEKRWRAEEDLRTLLRAQEIAASKARMAEARRIAAEHQKALSKVSAKVVSNPAPGKRLKDDTPL